MPSVCFYFQVHQPWRLRAASSFQLARDHWYFDDEKNRTVMRKVADKCYLPMTKLIRRMIESSNGRFKCAFSITGTALDQMRLYAPEVIEEFKQVVKTGCVEILGETYYHSLAALYDQGEFAEQVRLHSVLMKSEFGVTPRVFRNTELIFSDEIGALVAKLGFDGVLAEGWDPLLGWRSPNFVYRPVGQQIALLLKNYRLSDDIAFRFSNRGWADYPLTTEKFAGWVHQVSGAGDVVNLFMDYETFGEHQWADSGIFDFMEALPPRILAHPDWDFATPSEVIARYPKRDEVSFPVPHSWADTERDLSAWRGNQMQDSSLKQIYSLHGLAHERGGDALETWRKLLTSDHFYYMCTKWFADGDVHAYFSPFDSPYDAFVAYMNALRDFRGGD
jgi:alpha-amylase